MDSGESRSGNNDATRHRRQKRRGGGSSFAMHVAFSLRKFHIWLESSLHSRCALFIIVLNRHARKREGIQPAPLHASSRLFLLPLSVRSSPLFRYVRRERVSRRAMHFPRIGSVIARLIFQSFFPRRERAQRESAIQRGVLSAAFHRSSFVLCSPSVCDAPSESSKARTCPSLLAHLLLLRPSDARAFLASSTIPRSQRLERWILSRNSYKIIETLFF